MKKDQKLPNKNIHSKNSSENHSQISIITIDNNDPTKITIAGDLQVEEIHKISHKLDIAGLIVQTISFKATAQDQTQTEVFIQIITETVRIQMLGKDIIQRTVLEIPHKIESKTTGIIEIDSTQIIDHETIRTIDQTTTIVTLDHVTFPDIETKTTQIDKEVFLSQHTETTHNIQVLNKTIEAVHLNTSGD